MSCGCIAFWSDKLAVSRPMDIAPLCHGFLLDNVCALLVTYCIKGLTFTADGESSVIKPIF